MEGHALWRLLLVLGLLWLVLVRLLLWWCCLLYFRLGLLQWPWLRALVLLCLSSLLLLLQALLVGLQAVSLGLLFLSLWVAVLLRSLRTQPGAHLVCCLEAP